jgi:hypothetical protein
MDFMVEKYIKKSKLIIVLLTLEIPFRILSYNAKIN